MRTNFVEQVVESPLFKRQKRLNELFDLSKAYNIHKDMTPQQILMWSNSLLKPFSLQIKAGEKSYRLELQNDLLELIRRKNKTGKRYEDENNLLKQVVREKKRTVVVEDMFLDEGVEDVE